MLVRQGLDEAAVYTATDGDYGEAREDLVLEKRGKVIHNRGKQRADDAEGKRTAMARFSLPRSTVFQLMPVEKRRKP